MQIHVIKAKKALRFCIIVILIVDTPHHTFTTTKTRFLENFYHFKLKKS